MGQPGDRTIVEFGKNLEVKFLGHPDRDVLSPLLDEQTDYDPHRLPQKSTSNGRIIFQAQVFKENIFGDWYNRTYANPDYGFSGTLIPTIAARKDTPGSTQITFMVATLPEIEHPDTPEPLMRVKQVTRSIRHKHADTQSKIAERLARVSIIFQRVHTDQRKKSFFKNGIPLPIFDDFIDYISGEIESDLIGKISDIRLKTRIEGIKKRELYPEKERFLEMHQSAT